MLNYDLLVTLNYITTLLETVCGIHCIKNEGIMDQRIALGRLPFISKESVPDVLDSDTATHPVNVYWYICSEANYLPKILSG